MREEVHGSERIGSEEAGLSRLGLAKLLFFGAAAASLLVSVFLFFSGDRERGIFVGLWVPSVLSAGTLILGGRDDG